MLHLGTINSLIIERTPLLWGLVFVAVLVLLPISAGAQCRTWEAGREMLIVQPGFQSRLTIQQNGPVITGNAIGSVRDEDGTRTITAQGPVDGTFDGNNFSIQIYWYNDHTGVYNGKVLPSGRLDGEGYEKRSPNIRVPWHSEGVLKCAPPPPPPTPKPIKSSGKARIEVLALPLPAGMQCTQWDVSGAWNIEVKSGPRKGYVGNVSFRQSGRDISGKVTNGGLSTGTVTNGTSDGDTFGLYVLWDGNSADGSNAEVFVGKISADGIIEGTALLIGDRSQKATWSSDRAMKCVKSGPAPPKPPYITASQPIVIANAPLASIYLGWDSGPYHPNVAVWLSMDNGAEIPAFSMDFAQQSPLWKQPKTGGEMKLQRGHHYKYVLKDIAGRTLSTVGFVVP